MKKQETEFGNLIHPMDPRRIANMQQQSEQFLAEIREISPRYARYSDEELIATGLFLLLDKISIEQRSWGDKR